VRLVVDPDRLEAPDSRRALREAAMILRRGGLVALPTETVYGLGANALDPAAVARIFAAKERPAWDPVIVHLAGPVSGNSLLDSLVTEIPPSGRALISAFWPGPLTLLLPRSPRVPDIVTAGRPLVGVRMPTHPVAAHLIAEAGVPLAAPSANLFGHISPTRAEHVLADLEGRIDAVLDAGPAEHGVESTVLDPNQSPIMIYRPGAITAEQIESVAGPVRYYVPQVAPDTQSLPAPGVGIRHYAPRARMVLIDAPLEELESLLGAAIARQGGAAPIGLLLPAELQGSALVERPDVIASPWGSWSAPAELARRLYTTLRELEQRGCSVIICPLPPEEGIGLAIRDRLAKAAG